MFESKYTVLLILIRRCLKYTENGALPVTALCVSAANDPIIWRPSNLTNLGRAPFYGLQPTWGGVRFLGGSRPLAPAVVIREVQIGDFSHSRHSHLPHLEPSWCGCWGISLKYPLCLRQWRKICQLLFIALSFEDDSLNNFNVML